MGIEFEIHQHIFLLIVYLMVYLKQLCSISLFLTLLNGRFQKGMETVVFKGGLRKVIFATPNEIR